MFIIYVDHLYHATPVLVTESNVQYDKKIYRQYVYLSSKEETLKGEFELVQEQRADLRRQPEHL